VFVLDPKLQGGPKQPACRDQFLGYSQVSRTFDNYWNCLELVKRFWFPIASCGPWWSLLHCIFCPWWI